MHHWFRTLKSQATKAEWERIADLSFHDLRHDFAHRAREAGWSLEEVAYYLGHITLKGTPAIQTTARYTQVSRAQVKEKLRLLRSYPPVRPSNAPPSLQPLIVPDPTTLGRE